MARVFRVKCTCGNVANAQPGHICPKCHKEYPFAPDGMITLYRKGSPLGIAGGFGIYIDEQPYGYIGNKETVHMPLPYGKHRIHLASGMNRRCTDMIIDLNPQNRRAFIKVWMKPGFWQNTFVLEACSPEEMPEI